MPGHPNHDAIVEVVKPRNQRIVLHTHNDSRDVEADVFQLGLCDDISLDSNADICHYSKDVIREDRDGIASVAL